MPFSTFLLRALTPPTANPFLRNLVPSVGLAFAVQAAFAVPSIAFQSERFYDLSGSLTYLSCTALSLALPTLRARIAATAAGTPLPAYPSVLGALTGKVSGVASIGALLNWRMVLLSTAVGLWSLRLGTYLFSRILSEKEDSRFKDIRGNPPAFFGAFMIQAVWVSACLMPVLAVNALPAATVSATAGVGLLDVLGLALYVGGLTTEVVADRQKSQWSAAKQRKEHDEQFITSGLWGRSRHPNYFGEMTLWAGIATTASGVLASSAGVSGMGLLTGAAGSALGLSLAWISPAFVSTLLLKVSGVPMSEKKYDENFKDDPKYQQWRHNTPMIIPKLG